MKRKEGGEKIRGLAVRITYYPRFGPGILPGPGN
jgi:hypothetical protein